MKITNIEIIPIALPLANRYDNHHGHTRMYDIDQHAVVKITTDNGIVGYGDYEDRTNISQAEIEPLIDRNPFDFIGNNFNMAIGMALYDVMGKLMYKAKLTDVYSTLHCFADTRRQRGRKGA